MNNSTSSTTGNPQSLRSSSVPASSKIVILSSQSHQPASASHSNSRYDQKGDQPSPIKETYFNNNDTKLKSLVQKDANYLSNPSQHQPKIFTNFGGSQQKNNQVPQHQVLPPPGQYSGSSNGYNLSNQTSNQMPIQQQGLQWYEELCGKISKLESQIWQLEAEKQEQAKKNQALKSEQQEMAKKIKTMELNMREFENQFSQLKASSGQQTRTFNQQDYSPSTPPRQNPRAYAHQPAVAQSQIGNVNTGQYRPQDNLQKEENKGNIHSTSKYAYNQNSNQYYPNDEVRAAESKCKEMKPDCQHCKSIIESEYYCSPCNHYFHKQCLLDLISDQCKNSVHLKCYCKENILVWVREQFYNIEPKFKQCLEKVFDNQLNKLKSNMQAKICCSNRNCKFWIASEDININGTRNNKIYCPDCIPEQKAHNNLAISKYPEYNKQVEIKTQISNYSQRPSYVGQSQFNYSNMYGVQQPNQGKSIYKCN